VHRGKSGTQCPLCLHIRNESSVNRERDADVCVTRKLADDLDVYPELDRKCQVAKRMRTKANATGSEEVLLAKFG
jgi:hypothetical protein